MAEKKKSLVGLVTGGNRKNTVTKKSEVEVVVIPKTPEEERDLKAKQTVEKLLEDVSLVPKEDNDEELLEINQVEVKPVGTEWLQEQVALLSSENENLKIDLATAKDDYTKILNEFQKVNGNNPKELLNETINQNIVTLFTELQNNLMGHNQERTVWTTVNIKHILNQMLVMFPFTHNYRKF